MKILKLIYIAAFTFLVGINLNAQKQVATNIFSAKKSPLTEIQLQRWSHLDLEKDSVPGMSVDKAYEQILKGKEGIKVIVGVIDSGVDINHEDLKNSIWTNKKEIEGNGIDDDKNGYIDDIHGWNFLGDSNNENFEYVRILKKGDDGSKAYKDALALYEKKMAENLDTKQETDFILAADKRVREFLKKDVYTVEDLKKIQGFSSETNQAKRIMLSIAAQAGSDFQEKIKDQKERVYIYLNFKLNKEFDGRKIVGDNPDDFNDRKYGNNIIYSKERGDSFHGTHVAGIIAQGRNNGIGGDGVADNVEIMPIRAVPEGDEYDKDIALSIRYAVDNGAKIINGSFGKAFSTHPSWVWDAIKYAASKDVLIIFAAGNEEKNLDVEPTFPTDSLDKKTEIVNNVLTIGALDYEYGEGMVANFSNYGAKNVDIFAPGVKIYATVPEGQYKYLQGTSMASPNAAGVAVLIRSYYPNLKASQVKEIIMKSGTPINLNVAVGEKQEKISFAKASVSGKIVNAYNALKMAETFSKKIKSTLKN